MRSRIVLAAVLPFVLAFNAAVSGAAHAAPAAGDCPFIDTVCLFSGEDFTGDRLPVSALSPSGACVSLVDAGWGDRARSAINTNRNSAAMFMNDDCIGDPYQIPGNVSMRSFGGFTPESIWVP